MHTARFDKGCKGVTDAKTKTGGVREKGRVRNRLGRFGKGHVLHSKLLNEK